MFMAIILYESIPGKVIQSFLFREDVNKIHDAVDEFKKKLKQSNCTFVASIVESVEDNFLKDQVDTTNPIFH